MIGKQTEDSLCRVLSDSVQYQWNENDNKYERSEKMDIYQKVGVSEHWIVD